METRVVLVNAEMAKKWLARRHPEQRDCREGTVVKYMNRMLGDRWVLVPEPIAFDTEDFLIQGQHRMEALVRANLIRPGIAFQFNVSTNVEGSFSLPMDQGVTRTAEDRFGWPRGVAAIVRMLGALESGTPAFHPDMEGLPSIYERNEEYILKVHGDFYTSQKSALATPALAVIAFALPISKMKVLEFASRVKSGEELRSGDPELRFRNWVYENTGGGGGQYIYALAACTAIRAVLQGKSLKAITTTQAGYRYLCERRRLKGVPNTPSLPEDSE